MSINAWKMNNPFIVLLLLVTVYAQFLCGDYGDKNLLLYCAYKFTEGKKLYQDIFDLASPVIIVLYAAPELLARYTGISDSYCLVALGLGVIALSIHTCLRLINFSPAFARDPKKQKGFGLLLLFIFIFLQNPCYFLDREHLFLVFCLPYLMRFMPSLGRQALPRSLSVRIALMAGIGFCIKPHFAVLFCGIQLASFLRERAIYILFSMENKIIYAMGAVYVCLVFVVTPDYIYTVIPIAWLTYSAYNMKHLWVLYLPLSFTNLGIILADFRLYYTSPYRKDIFYFLTILPWFSVYIMVNNGWSYTWNLLLSYILFINGFILLEFFWLRREYARTNRPVKPFIFGIRANCISLGLNSIVMACVFCSDIYGKIPAENTLDQAVYQLIANLESVTHEKQITTFGAISLENTSWARIARYSGAHFETRFSHLWMIPKFVIKDKDFAVKHQWILDYVADSFAFDLDNNKPKIMLVDHYSDYSVVRQSIDFLPYMDNSAHFRAAWRHYQYITTIDGLNDREQAFAGEKPVKGSYHQYQVYKRID